jgi:alpha-1,6-mannosyltransferase
LKICDITQFFTPTSGGVKRYLLSKADYILSCSEHEQLLILPGPKDSKAVNGPLTTYTIRSPYIIGTQSYRLMLRMEKIRHILRQEKPDLVEVGDPYQVGWAAARLARELDLPVVAYYHSDYPRALGRTVQRFAGRWPAAVAEKCLKHYLIGLYNRMDATFVAQEQMIDILSACGIRSLYRVPIGIDTEVFSPQPSRFQVRSQMGIDQDRFLILYVGRMSREKNIRLLLHLIESLSAQEPDKYHLLMVGEGHLDGIVNRASKRRTDVTWCRYCADSSRLAEFYSAADLFIHAGKVETYGLTVLEAQSCGTPVVALDGGGTGPLNQVGEKFLAPDPTVESFSETIHRARSLVGEDIRTMVRQKVVEHYDSRTNFAREFDIYRHVLQSHAIRYREPLTIRWEETKTRRKPEEEKEHESNRRSIR